MSALRKIWRILSPAHRKRAFVMIGLMLIGMVVETLGVGLVIPLVALMTQVEVATRFPVLAPLLGALGNPTQQQLVLGGMVVLVGVFVIKAAFLSFLVWRQARYVADIQIELSNRLFAAYLRQPYTFHLQRNSAELIRNTSSEVSVFAGSFGAALLILTEVFVIVGVLTLLIAIEPLGALLVVVVLGVASWGYHGLVRGHLLRWGKEQQFHNLLRIQHLVQGLSGVKDVKLLGRETDFLKQYDVHNTGMIVVGQNLAALQQLPRLWLELLAVVGLAAIVLVMIVRGAAPDAILPTLGVFAAAAFRLLPSANRVLGSIQKVRYALPVLDTLTEEFRVLVPAEAPRRGEHLAFESALVLDRVTYQYEAAETPALRDVRLTIPRGMTVGLIGSTGAGKSTLVDIMLGLLTPDAGAVQVDGVDIQTNLRGWQDQIGYVPQSIYLTDDTLRRNIAFGLPKEEIDEAAVWRALDDAQMSEWVRDLALGLDTVVGERGVRLSGGQRQRIGIARALYHDPAVLVLDEATSSLDSTTEAGVMEAIRALYGKKTVIIVAHRLSTVEHCDHLYRLEQGQVVEEGSTAAILGRVAASSD